MNAALRRSRRNRAIALFFPAACAILTACASTAAVVPDPLPSWDEGQTKTALVDFIERVSTDGSPDFVPPPERIAAFDNDGTLWAEQPVYVQMAFAMARIHELAPNHPEWRHEQPFQGVLENDLGAALVGGNRAIVDLIMASHAGMTTEGFEQVVRDWLAGARHPRFQRLYTDLVYQPMLELIRYLEARDFQVYIVSGGGVEFMRPWSERVYGLPRSHVIGSTIETELAQRGGTPVLVRRPEVDFVDDGPGKPVGIHEFVGRRPIAAFGNSDGDLQMLQWTTAGNGARLALLVHHTDAAREWAYDRESHVGKLDDALDQARARGWIVVDMKRDWRRIFPFDEVRATPSQSLTHWGGPRADTRRGR